MNTNTLHHLAAGLLLTVTSAGLIAQGSPNGAPSTSVTANSYGIDYVDGVLWGVGAAYKASFDRGGVEYTPALGERAPRNLPLRFTLESIRRDDLVLHDATDGQKQTPDRQGDFAVYDRDNGIAERFQIRADGVEVSYVFPERPRALGDLVVRARLDTELQTDFRGLTEKGIAFRYGKVGGVSIGAVTGIDALGWKVRGTVRYDGSHVEFVLPDAFVGRAAYPLVLDPLLGTEFDVDSTYNTLDADTAYDTSNGEYLVVYERRFSSSDIDVYGQRVSTGGALNGGTIFIATAGITEHNPTVANVNQRNRFLVAYEDGGRVFGPFDINCRSVQGGTGALSPEVGIATTTANEIQPDAGNEETTLDDEALLVWNEQGAGIRAAQVRIAADGTVSLTGTVTTVTMDGDDSKPAVSSGGTVGRHVVCWQRQQATSLAVYAHAIDRNAALLGSELTIRNVGFVDEDEPDVDGNGTTFLIAYEEEEGSSSTKADIYCQRVRWDGADLVIDGSRVAVENDANEDERTPAVGFCGEKYLIAWAEEGNNSTFDYDVYVRGIDPRDCGDCGPTHWISSDNPVTDLDPEIGTREVAGSTGDDALVVFSSAVDTPPFTSEVHAHRWEAVGGGGGVFTVHPSCGGGGTCTVVGAFAFQNNVSIQLNGADPAANIAALHIGDAFTPIAPCFGCSILPPFLAIGTPIAGGFATVPLSIDCSISLAGGSWRFQYVVGNTTTAPCLGIPAGFSNIEQATFGY